MVHHGKPWKDGGWDLGDIELGDSEITPGLPVNVACGARLPGHLHLSHVFGTMSALCSLISEEGSWVPTSEGWGWDDLIRMWCKCLTHSQPVSSWALAIRSQRSGQTLVSGSSVSSSAPNYIVTGKSLFCALVSLSLTCLLLRGVEFETIL